MNEKIDDIEYINTEYTCKIYTDEDKKNHPIYLYIKELCDKFNVNTLTREIIDFCIYVFQKIKLLDTPRRNKLKEAIVILCINYIYQQNNLSLNFKETKYITKANKILLELKHLDNTFNIDKQYLLKRLSPFEHIKKYNLNDIILKNTKRLIDLCEINDVLMNHTNLSIGLGCLYYVLNEMDKNLIIENINITELTIKKIFKELKTSTIIQNNLYLTPSQSEL